MKNPLLVWFLSLMQQFKPVFFPGSVSFDKKNMRRGKKIDHFVEILHPRGEKHFNGRSAYQTYKPLNAPRHILKERK